jgi:hypothetical protein
MTEDDDDQQENATATFVSLGRTNPDGTESGNGIVFSIQTLLAVAFLNNVVGIAHIEISSVGITVQILEWKGGMLPI